MKFWERDKGLIFDGGTMRMRKKETDWSRLRMR
jgi:hypothetical protein